jgi:hypothetical protein
MRKFILIAATLLVSVSAHAGQSRGLIEVASSETVQQAEPAPSPTVAEQLKTKAPKPQATATEAKSTDVKPVEAKSTEETPTEAKPATKRVAQQKVRRESDEHKARRIAARYGVYW